MAKRIIVLLFGDTHAGSELGLMHPETVLERETEDGNIVEYTPELTEIQKFIFYEAFRPGVEEIMGFAGKDEVLAIHLGDGTQGIKYMDEVVTNKMAVQILIAAKNATEVLKYKNVKKFRMLRSTPSHEGGAGDTMTNRLLRNEFPKTDIAMHYHGEYYLKDFDYLMDVAHHGASKGIRKWLEGNNFRYYMRDILERAKWNGDRLPNAIIRAHTHGRLEEHITIMGEKDHRAWGIITPPLQYPGSWVRQVTRSVKRIEMGMCALEIIQHNERFQSVYPHWYIKKLNIATKEIL